MDALALLCTLHADGPATLRRLRLAGCESVAALGELDADRLAELLELTPAGARRFLREAQNLLARLGDDLLEREDGAAPRTSAAAPPHAPGPHAPSSRAAASSDGAAARQRAPGADDVAPVDDISADVDDAAAALRAVVGTGRLGTNERTILTRVLSAWRERDEREPVTAASRAPGGALSDRDSHAAADRSGVELARPAVRSGLRPGALDGLTEECCRRLSAAEVASVADLVARDPLELAQSTGLGFTLVQRLQFLARRRVATTGGALRPADPLAPVATAVHPRIARSDPGAPLAAGARSEPDARGPLGSTAAGASIHPLAGGAPLDPAVGVRGAPLAAGARRPPSFPSSAKFSAADAPEVPVGVGWDYELLPRAGQVPVPPPRPLAAPALDVDQPADAAGPFA